MLKLDFLDVFLELEDEDEDEDEELVQLMKGDEKVLSSNIVDTTTQGLDILVDNDDNNDENGGESNDDKNENESVKKDITIDK